MLPYWELLAKERIPKDFLSLSFKIISNVPVDSLIRTERPPNKEILRYFIRHNALRAGMGENAPWVVEDELVKKYSLPSKFSDFLLDPHKVRAIWVVEKERKGGEPWSSAMWDLTPDFLMPFPFWKAGPWRSQSCVGDGWIVEPLLCSTPLASTKEVRKACLSLWQSNSVQNYLLISIFLGVTPHRLPCRSRFLFFSGFQPGVGDSCWGREGLAISTVELKYCSILFSLSLSSWELPAGCWIKLLCLVALGPKYCQNIFM